jgi:predicted site-specific integrase-resolvase
MVKDRKMWKGRSLFFYIYYMKAKDVMLKYSITRRTLHNWVKKGIIEVELTPTGRYIYIEKIKEI